MMASNSVSTVADVFNGSIDRFNGITVRSWEQSCKTVETFQERLEASLSFWKNDGIRGVWFKIGLQQTEWIPVLVKHDFKFHHSKPTYTALCHWLPTDCPNMIPVYAHTTVGIGAIVITEDRKVLAIQENTGKANYKIWKFPGGYVEEGEELSRAAVREVLEETGIQTEFCSIVSFRHNTKGYNFNCSDLYFVAHLKPLSAEIHQDKNEIAKCQWMDVDEFLNHPQGIEMNKHFLRQFIANQWDGLTIGCKTMLHPMAKNYVQMYGIQKKPQVGIRSNSAPGPNQNRSKSSNTKM